jgi:hypothetical protein
MNHPRLVCEVKPDTLIVLVQGRILVLHPEEPLRELAEGTIRVVEPKRSAT